MIAVEHYPKIETDFATYEAFLAHSKIAEEDPVTLLRPRTSTNLPYVGRSDVHLGWVGFPCELVIEKSPRIQTKYGLKIFARLWDDKPCFRFDSRGSTHVNPEKGAGLPARAVSTPHFHRIDSDGILIAYKTPALSNAEQCAQIVASPRKGTNLFCQEANLFSESGRSVVPEIMPDELDMSTDDPLSGAIFPRQ